MALHAPSGRKCTPCRQKLPEWEPVGRWGYNVTGPALTTRPTGPTFMTQALASSTPTGPATGPATGTVGRRSAMLLGTAAVLTLAAGLLLALEPEPLTRAGRPLPLAAEQVEPVAEPVDLAARP